MTCGWADDNVEIYGDAEVEGGLFHDNAKVCGNAKTKDSVKLKDDDILEGDAGGHEYKPAKYGNLKKSSFGKGPSAKDFKDFKL